MSRTHSFLIFEIFENPNWWLLTKSNTHQTLELSRVGWLVIRNRNREPAVIRAVLGIHNSSFSKE
jgi:hypothetical protein